MKYEEILKQASQTIDEIEALRKSYEAKMAKDADEEEKEEEEPSQEDAAEAMSEASAPASDASMDLMHQADEHGPETDAEDLQGYAKQLSDDELFELMEALSEEAESRGGEGSEEEQAPEMDKAEDEEGMSEEGMDEEAGDEESMDSVSEKVAQLSDEELETLMQACAAEKSQRGAPEEAPQEEMDKTAMGAEGAYMMKSLKEETQSRFDSLSKSIESVAKSVAALSKQVSALKDTPVKKSEMPASTYSDSKVKVLEKSAREESSETYLYGSDIQNWLLEQQKKGDKKVNSDLVSKAGLAKSEDSARFIYEELQALGLNPPRKKA